MKPLQSVILLSITIMFFDSIEKDAPVKLESYIPDFGNSLNGTNRQLNLNTQHFGRKRGVASILKKRRKSLLTKQASKVCKPKFPPNVAINVCKYETQRTP